jgi:polysaccharide export outer membrane protein
MKKNLLWLFLASFCLFQTATAQEPVSRVYTIGPGDEIEVKVLGEKDFDAKATVDENGNIELPFFESPVPAMCKTERELRADVTKLLGKYLRSPQVGLNVTGRKSRPPVLVSGEVKTQQQVTLTRKTRLWELITFSGGITEDAGGMVEVFRTQPPLCAEPNELANWKAEAEANKNLGIPSRMYSISSIQQGRDDSNPIIYPGDVISIQKGKPVYIVGEVKQGQPLMIKEGGLSLVKALAMSGGPTSTAKTKDVKIYRLKPDSLERETISVNYEAIKKEGKNDVLLQPYDIVEVGKAKDGIGKTLLTALTGAGVGGIGTLGTGALTRILY